MRVVAVVIEAVYRLGLTTRPCQSTRKAWRFSRSPWKARRPKRCSPSSAWPVRLVLVLSRRPSRGFPGFVKPSSMSWIIGLKSFSIPISSTYVCVYFRIFFSFFIARKSLLSMNLKRVLGEANFFVFCFPIDFDVGDDFFHCFLLFCGSDLIFFTIDR